MNKRIDILHLVGEIGKKVNSSRIIEVMYFSIQYNWLENEIYQVRWA